MFIRTQIAQLKKEINKNTWFDLGGGHTVQYKDLVS